MKLLWQYLKNYKSLLAIALVLATINQVFSLLDPQIFRIIIDKYANNFDKLSQNDYLKGVSALLFATIGVAFASRLAKSFQDYYTNVITQKLGAKLYNDSVKHSFSLPFSVFEDARSGEFLSKLQIARSDSQNLINNAISLLFFSAVGVIFVLVYAFIVHWWIGVAYALLFPILGIVTMQVSKKIKAMQTAIVEETQNLAGSTTETLRNVELVKSLGLESQETNRLNNTNQKILDLELKKVKTVRSYNFLLGTIINFLRMIIMFLMLYLIFTRAISLGEFFTLLFYSFFIFNPLSELGKVFTSYQETKASMAKLEEILGLKPEPLPALPAKLSSIKKIEFKNVCFSYQSAAKDALSSVSFQIEAGTTAAFVGPSGSGKSTIIKLMSALYKPTLGDVLFNQISVSKILPAQLRQSIGLVAQETQLFAGTIRENLLFASPKATDQEIISALEAAQARKLIEKSSLGLSSKIGEGGLKLSGGEKQRLAIARALLRKPEVLIFDEATSSLDSITEQAITETIKTLGKIQPDAIKILVAHRLSTIMHADTIYVLEKGKIIEQGTHHELLNKAGLYQALWRSQASSD